MKEWNDLARLNHSRPGGLSVLPNVSAKKQKGTFTDFLTRRQTFIYNVATLENKLPLQWGKIWNKDRPPQFPKKSLIFTAVLNYWRELWFARNEFRKNAFFCGFFPNLPKFGLKKSFEGYDFNNLSNFLCISLLIVTSWPWHLDLDILTLTSWPWHPDSNILTITCWPWNPDQNILWSNLLRGDNSTNHDTDASISKVKF